MRINKDTITFHGQELIDILIKKNHDYGNSVQEQFDEYGITSILIRLDDKMRRLKHLRTNDPSVTEENIKDTLKDLSGYALLGLMCVTHEDQKVKPFHFDVVEEIGKLKHVEPTIISKVVAPTEYWIEHQNFMNEQASKIKEAKKPPYADLDD